MNDTNPNLVDLPPIQTNISYVDQHGNELDPVLVEQATAALARAEAKRERKLAQNRFNVARGGARETSPTLGLKS